MFQLCFKISSKKPISNWFLLKLLVITSNFPFGNAIITEYPRINYTKLWFRVCYCDILKGILQKKNVQCVYGITHLVSLVQYKHWIPIGSFECKLFTNKFTQCNMTLFLLKSIELRSSIWILYIDIYIYWMNCPTSKSRLQKRSGFEFLTKLSYLLELIISIFDLLSQWKVFSWHLVDFKTWNKFNNFKGIRNIWSI